MQKVRMLDIAQKLGVSTVTVHNALCGRKGVSDEMRDRIIRTAKEMGYEAAPASKKKEKEKEKVWKIGVLIAENYLAQQATYYWKMYQEFAYPGYTEMKITTYEVDMKAMTKTALDKLLKQLRTHGRSRSMDVISGHILWKNSVKMK